MGDDGREGEAVDAVAAFTAAVDGLLGLPVTSLPGLALVELVALGRGAVPPAAHVRSWCGRCPGLLRCVRGGGGRNTATVLVQTLRLSPGEAASRVRAAKELGPRVDFTGGAMPPLYPGVAAAQAAGDISVAHARAITSTVDKVPAAAKAEHGDGLERSWSTWPTAVTGPGRPAGVHALAVLDPDGTLTTDKDHHRLRGLTFTPTRTARPTCAGTSPRMHRRRPRRPRPPRETQTRHPRPHRRGAPPRRTAPPRCDTGPAELRPAHARRPARRRQRLLAPGRCPTVVVSPPPCCSP